MEKGGKVFGFVIHNKEDRQQASIGLLSFEVSFRGIKKETTSSTEFSVLSYLTVKS